MCPVYSSLEAGLYWDELSWVHRTLGLDKTKGGTNHHIRMKEWLLRRITVYDMLTEVLTGF